MSPQQGQLRIAAPKPVYSALHHRSFVLQDVRVEGDLAPSEEPREPEPTRTSSFSPSSASTEKRPGLFAFHQDQQPPGSFQQQLPVLPLSQPPGMIQSHPPPSHSPSVLSSRTHHSASMSFARSKTPPALFNPTSTDSSSTSTTTRQGQVKSSSLGHPTSSPRLSGGRPLPAVPLASQDSTGSSRSLNTNSSDNSHRSATYPLITSGAGSNKSTWPRSSASLGSSASSKPPHTHTSLSTPSIRTQTPPSLINTASGSSTAFPMPSDIKGFDRDNASKANNAGRGGSGGNTMHATHARGSHVQSTHAQGTQGAQYTFHQNQNQSTSSPSSSVLFGSAALSSPAFVSSPSPLSPPPPPPPAMVAMTALSMSGHVPSASVGASAILSTMMTKSGGTSTESAGNWSISKDRRGSNPNTSIAVNNSNNSNSSKINSGNSSGSSTNSNTALVRPLPLPPGSTPRTRTRSNNTSNVFGGPPGSHTSSVNVPISWASRPVDLNRSVPASHAGHSGGEHQQHQLQQQPGQQIQQGQGQQPKTYSRPPSRPSLRSTHPSSRPSSRPSSPSGPNLAFGPGPSTTSSTSGAASLGAGRPSSPPLRSKTITSTTRSTTRRLRSRSTSRPKTQIPAGAAAGVLRYESFSGVAVAMGTSAAAPAVTSPTAASNTAPSQARLAPQGSRNLSTRKRSATDSSDGPPNVIITKSQPVGSGLSMATNTTTSQPMTRQAPKRSAIPPRSTPPQSQLPSPPSVLHHQGITHGHASSPGLTPGHNTSLLTPLSTATPMQSAQTSGSKRHQGGVQLSRQLVSRAAAVPAPLNPNYNYVVAKGGVYYVRDKDPYPYHQRPPDEKGKGPETDTGLVSKKTYPVRPLPKPGVVQPHSSDEQPTEDATGIDVDAEDGGKPTNDDDDAISCLSYIDSPDSAIGVHPDLGSLSFAEDDDMALSDDGDSGERGQEEPLLVYIDDNFASSGEGEQFVKSVSPMRYARPGSAGTVGSADDGGSDMSSDFFSDVDDPFKYNKGRSKRRGRTRTTVPVGLGEGSNETAGVGPRGSQLQKEAKGKPGIRMTGSLGSMRDLIENKAAKEKRKKEAADADAGGGGAITARTKSAERDRALPQRYGHPQESPLPPPPPRLTWFRQEKGSKALPSEGAEGGPVASIGDKLISPASLSSSQGGRSLSPIRYAKRMSVELLDDSSSVGSPISPIGIGGLLKGNHAKSAGGRKKKRPQPWSYQFDYQAAKASSPFTFGMGGEKAVEEKELSKREEQKKKVEEGKKREKAKSLRAFKTKEGGEGRKKLSIDVLDISLLRRSSQPALLEPGTTGAGSAGDDVFGLGSSGGGGSGGSGQQTFRTWDDSPASSATASSFTVIAAADVPRASNPVVTTPPAHSSPPSIGTTSPTPAASSVGRTRTFKVRNP